MSYSHSLMTMSFHTGTTDPVWLAEWVPQSEQAYIGTLVGILIFSILTRALTAARYYVTAIHALQARCRDATVTPFKFEGHSSAEAGTSDGDLIIPNPLALPRVPKFSWRVDLLRSLFVLLQTFLGYLLMLVVMTLNVGYFFAVLLGVFVGEVVFGRYHFIVQNEDDHFH
ncbi:Ctr copper transporter [Jimgerdemannia flammicorona]|uniref:Copper transport protein n=1 Tax=Jimgerdemannia flammicorona TaxID=994334 RepID=A0A433QPJ5_9FUNG|nr:Ctr copper transporter [Jimgerdemannia flammicorona]